jgi:hypothetical protein
MNYIGEHLFPGQLGHFLLVLSLISSLVASIAYFKAASVASLADQAGWRKMARIAFIVDAISVAGVLALSTISFPIIISNIITRGTTPTNRSGSATSSAASGKGRKAAFCCGQYGTGSWEWYLSGHRESGKRR